MRLSGIFVTAAALISGQAFAQPVVSSAVNSAGYMRPGLPNGGIAQSSYIAIFGSNLGPAVPPSGIVSATYPLQTTFQGVSARIGGRSLFIVYATPTQVGAVVPGDTPLGDQQLTLTYNNATSANLAVKVVARSFGLFTLNQAGTGPAVAFKYIAQGNEPVSTLFQSVNPGGVLTLYGTGAGASSTPDDQQSTPETVISGLNKDTDVEILVGNKKASIMYFGRPTWGSAIDQIVATLDNDTPTGCYVSLVVRVGGVTSNSTTISVAPPGKSVCSDPNGYTEEQLTAAQTNGGLRVGTVSLGKIATSLSVAGQTYNMVSDALTGTFFSFTTDQLVRSQGSNQALSVGSCQVFSFEGDSPDTVDPIRPTWLDAGAQLTATNSNGNQTLTKESPGTYIKSISTGIPGFPGGGTEYLTTGNHTVAGPGGPGVGSFNASINWPAVFVWSNKDALNTVNRNNGVTVNWTGGDDSGYVAVVGFSTATVSNKPVGAVFTCIEAANKHTLTVPSAITLALPVTATIQGTPMGNLTVTGISAPKSFTTAAPALDVANIIYSSSQSKTVSFQ